MLVCVDHILLAPAACLLAPSNVLWYGMVKPPAATPKGSRPPAPKGFVIPPNCGRALHSGSAVFAVLYAPFVGQFSDLFTS